MVYPSQTQSSDAWLQDSTSRILQILGDAEGVITNDTCIEDMLISLEPRPIGPTGDFLDCIPVVPPRRTPSYSLFANAKSLQDSSEVRSDSLTWLLAHHQQQQQTASTFPPVCCSSSSSSKVTMDDQQEQDEDDFEPIAYDTASSSSNCSVTSSTGHSVKYQTGETSDSKNCFRAYQQDQWLERFQDLIKFKQLHGHTLVPHDYPPNQHLAQWTKRQRYQYKLKQMGRHSTLTDSRQEALEQVEFVWDSHQAAWLEKLEALKAFKMQFGHTNVPTNYEEDRSLAIWVKCQRRQMKLCIRAQKSNKKGGPSSTMTRERCLALEQLGFDWNPRKLQL